MKILDFFFTFYQQMGFPGTSIDELELVSDDVSDETANEMADSDDEQQQHSKSKFY